MDKEVILVTTGTFWDNRKEVDQEILEGRWDLVFSRDLSVPDELAERVAAIALADQTMDGELMDRFPNLRTVARTGTGYDNIDLQAAAERDIQVTRVAGVNAAAVAQFALGCLMVLAREVLPMHRAMLGHRWERKSGRMLSEMTVGIVGLGAIGRAFAGYCANIGVQRMLAWNRTRRTEVIDAARKYDIEMVPLNRVMEESDAVVISLALTPDTRGIISESMLRSMSKGAILVNVARGAVVDERALAAMLAEDLLGGVALDAYSVELPSADPFVESFMLELIAEAHAGKNVILTPHASGIAPGTAYEIAMRTGRNIAGVLTTDLTGVELVEM